MSGLIKREDAIKATWHEPYYIDPYNVLTEVRDRIEALPTVDAVPVVRCRECKYMRESVDGLFKSGYFCERCHITSDMENCDDFYCADGERKDNENN